VRNFSFFDFFAFTRFNLLLQVISAAEPSRGNDIKLESKHIQTPVEDDSSSEEDEHSEPSRSSAGLRDSHLSASVEQVLQEATRIVNISIQELTQLACPPKQPRSMYGSKIDTSSPGLHRSARTKSRASVSSNRDRTVSTANGGSRALPSPLVELLVWISTGSLHNIGGILNVYNEESTSLSETTSGASYVLASSAATATLAVRETAADSKSTPTKVSCLKHLLAHQCLQHPMPVFRPVLPFSDIVALEKSVLSLKGRNAQGSLISLFPYQQVHRASLV